MAKVHIIYKGSDNVIKVTGLYDPVAAAYKNAATVQVTLTDKAGTQVSGETWPLAMDYVSASNGNYTATLKDTLTLVANQRYTATITADAGTDLKKAWVEEVLVVDA